MATSNRPNILFILTDQQRWDTLACYGRPIFPGLTPNLDAMAAAGVRFEHGLSMQPLCGPARACLQTGMYGTQTGCFMNLRPLPIEAPTIAKALGSAGYETAYVGKWHLSPMGERPSVEAPLPLEQRGGYNDYWMAANGYEFTSHGYEGYVHDKDGNKIEWEGYRADKTTDFALDYLNQYAERRSNKPFFLFLSYVEPHHQNDIKRYIGPLGSKQRFAHYNVPGDLENAGGDWPRNMPDYLGCCWSIDQNVGRLNQALERHGLEDNTLVIYTSDHGCHFCTRNSEYKRSCHDASIRVPYLLRGPGFTGGIVRSEMVSLMDLPATVLHAGGVNPPSQMHGRPLQDLVSGDAGGWPEEVLVQISESELGRAIRTSRWKYGVTAPHRNPRADADSQRYVETYLYDLDHDPHELNNRVMDDSLKRVRRDLAARLLCRMVEIGEPAPEIAPAGGATPHERA